MTLRSLALACAFVTCAASANAGTSNSLMDVSPDGTRLLVANADNGTVTVVDTVDAQGAARDRGRRQARGRHLDRHRPARRRHRLPRGPRRLRRRRRRARSSRSSASPTSPTASSPRKDGSRAWVTHEYPGTVSEIDLKAQQGAARDHGRLDGARHRPAPRREAAVRHRVLHRRPARRRSEERQGRRYLEGALDRQPVPGTSSSIRRRPKAYLSHIRSRIEVIDGSGSIFPQLSICDLVPPTTARSGAPRSRMDTYNGVYVVTNPWEAALSPDGKRLYTIYAGTNDMNVSTVIDDDYQEIERIGRAVQRRPEPAGHPRQPRRQDGLHLQRARLRGHASTTPTHAAAGDDQGVRAAEDAGVGARQGPVQHGQAADDAAGAGSPARRAIPTATATAGSGRTPRACARRRRCSAWPTRIRCTGRPTATRCRTSSTPSAAG